MSSHVRRTLHGPGSRVRAPYKAASQAPARRLEPIPGRTSRYATPDGNDRRHAHDPLGLVRRPRRAPPRAGARLPAHVAVRRPHGRARRAGSFVTARAGHVPIVLVRDREGALRAFVNVCRHRGYLLCEGAGRRETLQCPVPRLDLQPRRLAPHRAAGGVGARLRSRGARARPGAGRHLGPVRVRQPRSRGAAARTSTSASCRRLVAAGGVDVDALEFRRRAEAGYDANWKVCVENYLECYHCAVAHPSFSKAIDVAPDAYVLEEHPTFSSQYGPPKNGGGGVYDAAGEVDRGPVPPPLAQHRDQRHARAGQPLDRADRARFPP